MGLNLKPTCGLVSLQSGSKIIAFVDMVLGLIGIVWFVYMMGRYDIISLDPFEPAGESSKDKNLNHLIEIPSINSQEKEKALSTNHKAISLTLSAAFTFVNLIVFVILLVGAHRKSIGLCLAWFYIRCAVIVFKVIIVIIYIIGGRPLFSQIPYIFFVLIHIYGLWVVNSFVEELRGIKYTERLHEVHIKRNQEGIDNENGMEKVQKLRLELFHKENEGFQNDKN